MFINLIHLYCLFNSSSSISATSKSMIRALDDLFPLIHLLQQLLKLLFHLIKAIRTKRQSERHLPALSHTLPSDDVKNDSNSLFRISRLRVVVRSHLLHILLRNLDIIRNNRHCRRDIPRSEELSPKASWFDYQGLYAEGGDLVSDTLCKG